MVFSSYVFIFVFLPTALAAYYLAPGKFKHLVLTLFSLFFYGWANPAFVLVMMFTITLDYINGRMIERATSPAKRKAPVVVSIVANLMILSFFKYFNFGIDSFNAIMSTMRFTDYQFDSFFRVVLPLGISFYIFQSMSYVIDVYRRDAKVVTNYIDYACYVSMFPQLVAGPIIRFQEVADQLASRIHSWEKFSRGITFFMLGMGKKVLLANPCGKIADTAFNAGGLDVLDSWFGLTAYSFQIYFDFCGYSDMAIGLGLMLGFMFAKNFDSPYKSQSVTEFWQRWHLSLSTWLRDYLYIPLGGNRKGNGRTYINLALVMLLGGLWHGASWNFLIWGGIHGGYLAFERSQGKDSVYTRLPKLFRILLTFFIVSIAWVFFRAETLPEAWRFFKGLFGCGSVDPASTLIAGLIYGKYYVMNFILAGVIIWFMPQTWDFTRKLSWPKIAWCISVFGIALAALITQQYNPFIYFIF